LLHSETLLEIGPDVYVVEGARRAAIYALDTQKVYSINKAALNIIHGGSNHDGFMEQLKREVELYPQVKTGNIERPTVHLDHLWIELTTACNLRCIHCYGDFGRTKQPAKAIPLKALDNILKEAAILGCRSIQFTGGEPLLFKRLPEAICLAKAHGFRQIEIFTNATLLTGRLIGLLKENEVHIALSLYSADRLIHDKITGVRGSFDRLDQALCLLKDSGLQTRAGLILTKLNETQVDDVFAWWQARLSDSRISVDVVRPTVKDSHRQISPGNTILERYRNKRQLFETSGNAFKRSLFFNSCYAGKLAVTATGDVLPCIFSRKTIFGNIARDPLDLLLKKAKKSWGLSIDKISTCRDCEYRYACRDCRPLVSFSGSDALGKSPFCSYDPYSGKWA
jgi:radical SAM protein with 4Fe4S-binding SPASM domain